MDQVSLRSLNHANHMKSMGLEPSGSSSQAVIDLRVPSVISKRTGFLVLLWMIEVRSLARPAAKTSGRAGGPGRSL